MNIRIEKPSSRHTIVILTPDTIVIKGKDGQSAESES